MRENDVLIFLVGRHKHLLVLFEIHGKGSVSRLERKETVVRIYLDRTVGGDCGDWDPGWTFATSVECGEGSSPPDSMYEQPQTDHLYRNNVHR